MNDEAHISGHLSQHFWYKSGRCLLHGKKQHCYRHWWKLGRQLSLILKAPMGFTGVTRWANSPSYVVYRSWGSPLNKGLFFFFLNAKVSVWLKESYSDSQQIMRIFPHYCLRKQFLKNNKWPDSNSYHPPVHSYPQTFTEVQGKVFWTLGQISTFPIPFLFSYTGRAHYDQKTWKLSPQMIQYSTTPNKLVISRQINSSHAISMEFLHLKSSLQNTSRKEMKLK